jgi:hypothetical protein
MLHWLFALKSTIVLLPVEIVLPNKFAFFVAVGISTNKHEYSHPVVEDSDVDGGSERWTAVVSRRFGVRS